jgi:hypothetical protein
MRPPHQVNQTQADGQTEAGSPVLACGRGIDLTEGLEQGADPVGRDADTAILDAELDHGASLGVGPFKLAGVHRDFTPGGELDRVVDQIDEDLPQSGHITHHGRRHGAGTGCGHVDDEFKPFFSGAGRGDIACFFDSVAQVERLRLQFELARLDLGEVQDVVDHREQLVAGDADRLKVVALLGIQRGLGQQGTHAYHTVERRADLMAHGRQEGGLGPGRRQRLFARSAQFRCALRNAGFQCVVGLLQGQCIGSNLLAKALQQHGTVMQHLRQCAHLADVGPVVDHRHLPATELTGRFAQPVQPLPDAACDQPRQQGAQQNQRADQSERNASRMHQARGEITFGSRHHKGPAQSQALAERTLDHEHGFARGGRAQHCLAAGHHVAATLRLQRLQRRKTGSDEGVAALGGAAPFGPPPADIHKERVAGRTGHQRAALINHKRRPMGTDALGAQSIGELLQMQIHAKHARDAPIDVIHGL